MLGIGGCNYPHERGIPSKRESQARVDYVPALCTHRPSLLPIGWFSELLGLVPTARQRVRRWCREEGQTVLSRGSKSRNKVSVGEPAEGSLTKDNGANHWQTTSWSRCDGPNPGARDQVARMGCGEKTLSLSVVPREPWAVAAVTGSVALNSDELDRDPGFKRGRSQNTARHRRSLFRCCKRPSMYFSRIRNPYFDEEGVGSRQSLSAFLSSVASGVPRCAPRPAESLFGIY